MAKHSIINKKYNRLTVIKDSGKRTTSGEILWICRCDCGNKKIVSGSHLKTNHTKSYGCYKKEIMSKYIHKIRMKGGKKKKYSNTLHAKKVPLYVTWIDMKQRCYNSNHIAFKYYGGRGIYVCRRWRKSFKNFVKDLKYKPKEKTLNRINNNGPYGPWNCNWAIPKEQANNRGRYYG